MNYKTKSLVGVGIFTAIVLVLQLLGGGIKFTFFSITLVLLPIVVGSAVYRWKPNSWYGLLTGAWLGFVFGISVLLSGDAAAFLAINIPATVLVVLAKGILCGFAAGFMYKILENVNSTVAVVASGIICPVVNTGVFLIGCWLFFLPDLSQWALDLGYANVKEYIIYGLVGINFLIELGINIVLSPIIVRLIRIGKK